MKKKSICISVAMATYNGGEFLQQQLNSIADQTRLPDELIVSDDSSSDETLEILNKYSEHVSFKVIILTLYEHAGLIKNFENAILHCSGQVVVLSDQDDIWEKYKIEHIIRKFNENEGVNYVFSNADLINQTGEKMGRNLWEQRFYTEKMLNKYCYENQLEAMLRDGHVLYGMTMAFKSTYNHYIFPIESNSKEFTHDVWIGFMMAALGAQGMPISESLVSYRQHESQVVGATKLSIYKRIITRIFENKNVLNLGYADVLEVIANRLPETNNVNCDLSSAKILLREKAFHLRARAKISSLRGFKRLAFIFLEVKSGRYSRYSKSLVSAFNDFVFPM